MREETTVLAEFDSNGNRVPPTATTTTAPGTNTPWTDLVVAEEITPEQAADPYRQAANFINDYNQQGLNTIRQNSDQTIGVDRGGQRSLMPASNDNYLTRRYSTPVVDNLVAQFNSVASQQAFQTAANNEIARRQKEAEEAVAARRQRDYQRRLAARRASQAAAQAQQARQYGNLSPVADGSELGRDDVSGRVIVDSGVTTGVIGAGIDAPPANNGVNPNFTGPTNGRPGFTGPTNGQPTFPGVNR